MSISKRYLWLTIFSIAMGFLETAVVIYIRRIYYPEGFSFPLKLMDNEIMIVELFREAATLIMLFAAGLFTGRTKSEKFGMFLYAFAIWDIFYYVFLKITIDWPESLFTWDILFMIPTTWVGPVISPMIVTLSMILLALLISYFTSSNLKTHITKGEWFFLILGSVILILGFTFDYSRYILQFFSFRDLILLSEQDKIIEQALHYIRSGFPWLIFSLGQLLILIGILHFFCRNFHKK